MANTYTQLHIQFVFAVQGRKNLISPDYRIDVEKYITGIIKKRKHKLLAIYCMPDHIHLFVGLNPTDSISNLITAIKKSSKSYINDQPWMSFEFDWQRGYGAFSYSKSQADTIIKYILNQPFHHQKRSFREEYANMLTNFKVDFEEKYLFEFYE